MREATKEHYRNRRNGPAHLTRHSNELSASEARATVGRNDPCPCGSGKKLKYCCGRPGSDPGPEVLYIHPSKHGVDSDPWSGPLCRPYGLMPVGVVALVNLLRQHGISVRGLNFPLETMLSRGFSLKEWLAKQRAARVVMIDLHWYEHAYGALDTARACRKALPEAWTIIGGLTASAYAREILEHFAEVDFIIRGDAEKPLLELVQRLLHTSRRTSASLRFSEVPNLSYRVDGQVVENARGYCATSADLDRLDFVDINFLDHAQRYRVQQYVVPGPIEDLNPSTVGRGHFLCIARGCQHECAFCGGCRSAHEFLAGRKEVVACSPGKVAEDLARLQAQGITQASLSFDLVELGEAYWRDLFAKMGERGIKVGLYNELFQLAESSFVAEFAKHVNLPHSCLALSPLSGCERVRHLNGKRFNNKEFWRTLSLCKSWNLSMAIYFSMNLPGETEDTFEETLSLAQRIYDFYPHRLLKILCTSHTVDPCSPMSRYPEKYGVELSMTSFMDYYDYCRATRLPGPESRTELHRGFQLSRPQTRSLEAMANRWDTLAQGREANWLPIPPTW